MLATVLATAFVLARWAVAAGRDLTAFVVAGSMWTGPEAEIAVLPGPGYDGQFVYRAAVDPTALDGTVAGVQYDAPLRLQRLTYPLLAHVVALGRTEWVPAALVVVNVAAVAALALLGAHVARAAGRTPWAGLLVVAWSGLPMTVGRDLTEAVTAALLLAALLSWWHGRWGLATAAATGAVLSRETAVVLLAAFALGELLTRRTARATRPGLLRAAVPLLVPLAAFAAWQGLCWAATGAVPLTSSGGKNAVAPGSALLPAVGQWLEGAASLERAALVTLGQLLALAVVVGLALSRLRQTPSGLRAALVAALLVVLSLSAQVWKAPADLRTSTELYLIAVIVLLRSDARLRVPAVLATTSAVMTALLRVTSL